MRARVRVRVRASASERAQGSVKNPARGWYSIHALREEAIAAPTLSASTKHGRATSVERKNTRRGGRHSEHLRAGVGHKRRAAELACEGAGEGFVVRDRYAGSVVW